MHKKSRTVLRSIGIEEECAKHGIFSSRDDFNLELVILGIELDKRILESLVISVPDEVTDHVAVFVAEVAGLLICCADQHKDVGSHLPDIHQ